MESPERNYNMPPHSRPGDRTTVRLILSCLRVHIPQKEHPKAPRRTLQSEKWSVL